MLPYFCGNCEFVHSKSNIMLTYNFRDSSPGNDLPNLRKRSWFSGKEKKKMY